MFDKSYNKKGKWQIWYHTPSRDIRRSINCTRKEAFSRMHMDKTVIFIVKVRGLFKRAIANKQFDF